MHILLVLEHCVASCDGTPTSFSHL